MTTKLNYDSFRIFFREDDKKNATNVFNQVLKFAAMLNFISDLE